LIKASATGRWPSFHITESDLEPIFRMAAEFMLSSVRENFVRGGRPTWEPLKAGGPSFLFQSGSLLQSILPSSGSDFAEVGTSGIRYAAIHQFGGQTGRNHAARIPARPYAVFQDEDIVSLREMFGNELVKIINAKGENIAIS